MLTHNQQAATQDSTTSTGMQARYNNWPPYRFVVHLVFFIFVCLSIESDALCCYLNVFIATVSGYSIYQSQLQEAELSMVQRAENFAEGRQLLL